MKDQTHAADPGGGRVACYQLDAQDRIVTVDDAWDQFARQNSGGGAMAEDVLGQPLWRFVSGEATRSFLNALFFWSRTRGAPYRTSYRCDSPLVRRRYEIVISPQRSGLLKVESRLLELGPPSPERLELLAGLSGIERCSVCLRSRTPAGWQDCGHVDASGLPVVYDICNDCRLEAALALRDADAAHGVEARAAGASGLASAVSGV